MWLGCSEPTDMHAYQTREPKMYSVARYELFIIAVIMNKNLVALTFQCTQHLIEAIWIKSFWSKPRLKNLAEQSCLDPRCRSCNEQKLELSEKLSTMMMKILQVAIFMYPFSFSIFPLFHSLIIDLYVHIDLDNSDVVVLRELLKKIQAPQCLT